MFGPNPRDVLQLVCYPSMASRDCARIDWHIGCREEFRFKA